MTRHLAITAVTMLLVCSAVPAAGVPGEPDALRPPGGAMESAAPDSTETAPDSEEKTGAAYAAGGDVRRVRGGDLARLAGDVPGVRRVGSGWAGQRSSVARGVLPPALTHVTLRGRSFSDWVNGGLDLVFSSAPAGAAALVGGGPDLFLWPVYTSEEPRVRPDGSSALAPLSVEISPFRVPSAVPFGRFTMGSGAYGRRFLAAEFGRRFRERAGLVGFLENDDGRAPLPGGSFECARAGGAAFVDLTGGWTAEVGGLRSDVTRGAPSPGLVPASLGGRSIFSDVHLSVTNGATRLELYHTQSWIESDRLPDAIDARRDGAVVGLPPLGRLWPVSVQVERRKAEGDALGGGSEGVHLRADAFDTVEVSMGSLSVGAGVSLADEQSFPTAHAELTSGSGGGARWSLSGSLSGRHPTVVERSLVSVVAAAPDGRELTVRGSASLEPERALCLSAEYVRDDLLSGTGARAELVRAMRPIVLALTSDTDASPMNAGDESGGSLVVWTAAGDSTGPTGRLSAEWNVLDAEGALNANEPVPDLRARATASVPLSLFQGYLETRWEASLTLESGLAKGPWKGLMEDSRAVLTLAAVGSAGSARLFVTLVDALNTDTGRLPGADPRGRALTAGFSWRFLD